MTIDWDLILRLLLAGLMGGFIGFEREFRAKEAGIRTHFIVALGAALFMIISQYAFTGRFDAARVAAQVVSGIGFIGAGVIISRRTWSGVSPRPPACGWPPPSASPAGPACTMSREPLP